MNTKELNALISLLDDPDESVYGLVRERIVSLGAEIIPNLENIWELQTFGNAHRSRIEDLIHVIQFGVVRDALEAWSKAGSKDLFEGALLIARYQYPDMDVEESHGIINRLRRENRASSAATPSSLRASSARALSLRSGVFAPARPPAHRCHAAGQH